MKRIKFASMGLLVAGFLIASGGIGRAQSSTTLTSAPLFNGEDSDTSCVVFNNSGNPRTVTFQILRSGFENSGACELEDLEPNDTFFLNGNRYGCTPNATDTAVTCVIPPNGPIVAKVSCENVGFQMCVVTANNTSGLRGSFLERSFDEYSFLQTVAVVPLQ
jgi:hypothetical protein